MVVHPDSDQVSRVWSYSGYLSEIYKFRVRDFHPLRFDFPVNSATYIFGNSDDKSYNPTVPQISLAFLKISVVLWFGLFQFRSPLLSESLLISFPEGTKMVQFPSFSFNKL